LPRVPVVHAPSARSWVWGRGQRRRCPLVAPPNAIASTTPLIGRCQRLSRRCRRRAVIAVGFEVLDGSSSLSQRPLLFLALAPLSASSLLRCAILVASYLARSLSQLSSAVCRSTRRGAGCPPRCWTGRHHRGGLPRAKPHPQFRRRRGKTPMVTTPPIILVFIRLTVLRRLPRREFLGERSNAEHRRRPGRQSGTVS